MLQVLQVPKISSHGSKQGVLKIFLQGCLKAYHDHSSRRHPQAISGILATVFRSHILFL